MRQLVPILPGVAAVFLAAALGAQTMDKTGGGRDPAAHSPAGGEAYAYCSACHGEAMEGGPFGPALKGDRFAAEWAGKVDELRELIVDTMPQSAPRSLTEEQYAEVIQHIAAANGGLGQRAESVDGGQSGAGPVTVNMPTVHGDAASNISSMGLGPQGAPEEVFRDATYKKSQAEKRRKLAALTEVSASALSSPPESDWLFWRRTQDGSGYSPLAQINRANARDMKVQWSWSLPPGTNQLAPIVRDGVMFVQSAREVQALDATNGEMLWRFRREVPAQFRGSVSSTQRNFAIFGDKIFVATADRHLIALNFRTGKQVWDHEVVSLGSAGILTSSGPFMAGNVLIQGVSMGPSCSKGCFVVGVDPRSGKRLWTFNTVARPGEPGGDSWNNTPLDDRSGGAAWVAGTYDPDLDIVYFGTAGTYGISRLLTPGKNGTVGNNDALYTNSTIALKPQTGKLVWAHQHFPREIWDLDEVFERTLVNLPVKGRDRKLTVSIGKVGILDALDRRTGQYVFSKDFGLTNVVTAIDPATGARKINPDKVLQPNRPVDVCPSAEGARNWMATAYNPKSRTLYVPMEETCMSISWVQPDEGSPAKGRLDIGWSLKPPVGSDGKYGRVEAVDLVTRKTLWTLRDRFIPMSSLLSTAGGLLFTGNSDRRFRALDDRTGNTLWETRLNAVPNATPITYSVNGRQYVAIAAGGGGPHDADTVELTPESERSAPSTTIWVFAL